MLGHCRRATDVREQYRDVYLRAARREFVASRRQSPWILSQWGNPINRTSLPPMPPNGLRHPLHRGGPGKYLNRLCSMRKRFVTLDQYFAPLLFGIGLARHKDPLTLNLDSIFDSESQSHRLHGVAMPSTPARFNPSNNPFLNLFACPRKRFSN